MGRLRGLLSIVSLLMLLFSGSVWAEDKPVVTAVRCAAHDGVTRLVLEISDPVSVKTGEVAGQLSVDLPALDWEAPAKGLSRPVGLLRNWSYGNLKGGGGRLLLETDGDANLQKAFIIPPSGEGSYRLVLDIAPGAPARPAQPEKKSAAVPPPPPPPAMVQAPEPVASPPAGGNPIMTVTAGPKGATTVEKAAPPPAPAEAPVAATPNGVLKHPGGTSVAAGPMPEKAKPLPPPAPMPAAVPPKVADEGSAKPVLHGGKPIVVIDPGHGGNDPGAISLTGVYEKTIVLALGLEVKAQLDKGGKVKAVMTRDGDFFIPLRERVAIGRAAKADLFMSLHADTVSDPSIRGLSVYTLSQTSSDAEAQALADKENKSDIVAGIDLSNESPEVTNILIDLVQRESMNKSAVFAGKIIQSVQTETHNVLEANTHRFAGFAVLKAPDVPSVLVENGYLSNEKDEQMLRKPEYRAKLAAALARAIENYFAQPRKAAHP